MAGSRPYRRHPPSLPANQAQVRSQTLASPLRVKSDLSGDMAVSDQELDAIMRLLGGAFDDLLSGTGRG
jgi:hypothetical protein